MSFVKAKIHVSVCKDYIDFYEGKRLERIEGSSMPQKIKNNTTNLSNKRICRHKTDENKNTKQKKGFDNYKARNLKKNLRRERKNLKRVIGIVSNEENQKENERRKISVLWKNSYDKKRILKGEHILKYQKKKLLYEIKGGKVQCRYLIFNNKHCRKLHMYAMLKRKKVINAKKHLEINKRKIYKKEKKIENSSCKDFNIIAVVGKMGTHRLRINTHMNVEMEEEKIVETKNKKNRKKKIFTPNEMNNEGDKTKCLLFSKVKEVNYENTSKNACIQGCNDKEKENVSAALQIEEKSSILEEALEKEMTKTTVKSSVVVRNEKLMENEIAIEKFCREINEKKKDISKSKLDVMNNDECHNFKKHEKRKRSNMKEYKSIEFVSDNKNKKTQRTKCGSSKSVKENYFNEMEIGQSKEEKIVFQGKANLSQKATEEVEKMEMENGKNNGSVENKKVEHKETKFDGEQKTDCNKNKIEEDYEVHKKNNAGASVYDFINIASGRVFSESAFATIENTKEKAHDYVYKKNEEMKNEKIDAMEKNVNLNNVEYIPFSENPNAGVVLDNKDDNVLKNNNQITDSIINMKHSGRSSSIVDSISIKANEKQNGETFNVENMEYNKSLERLDVCQIEREKTKEEMGYIVLNETKLNKMEENNFSLLKKEDSILQEIKRKEANEMIQLNVDSSFSSPKGAGLYNKGQNICFFNSIIQSIIRTPYICKDLINKLHSLNCEKRKKKSFCFFCLFEQLACNIISNDNVTVNNVLVPYIHKYVCSGYKIGYQEDVHEYLRYFLSSLEKCSIYSAVYIQKMFTGVTKNVTICIKCNNVSLKYEQYYELSLDISSTNNLEDALKKFLSKEILEGENGYYCDKCKKKTVASKQCVINKLPRILTIQIKRFFMNSHFDIVKSHKAITYPLRLDMRYYINNYDKLENSLNKNVVTLYEKMFHQKEEKSKINSVSAVDVKTCFNNNSRKESTSVYRYSINCNREKKKENVEKTCMRYSHNERPDKFGSCNGNEKWCCTPIMNKLKGGNSSKSIYVLKEIENIFSDLPCEILQKNAKKKLSISDLRNIITEKKKLIFKSLSKVRFSKMYDDIYLKICKDLSKIYYSFKNNLENQNSILKTCLYKYRFDDSLVRLVMENTATEDVVSMGNSNRKDLTYEMHEGNDNISKEEAQNYFHFELTGLIKHIGSGTEYGHYVALTKSENNYLECDDRNVTYIKEKDMLSCLKNAYVFVYTCINPQFIDFYNKYIDVFEKNNFDMNLPVFEKNVEFKERITMPKGAFIKSLLY